MIDKRKVAERFLECHMKMSISEIAHKHGVAPVTVRNWEKRETPSWKTLKYLCDSQGISWDWLLDEVGVPHHPAKRVKKTVVKKPTFSTKNINHRFLSLFKGMKYSDIAAELGVTSSMVSEWKHRKSQVSWKKLDYVVQRYNVRWDWLIDGIEPKYRESENPD
ncbi:MAG: hypothetical protein LIQ30_10495 [Planctomycetes bacterium]|nr:hypothetical protein [Planctomycetota bacterium]